MEKHDILRSSFEETYDELIEPIFRYLYVRLGNRERARELAQETFMRTWVYLANGSEIRNMKAFLYTTATNLFKNELRGKKDVVSLDVLMENGYEPRILDGGQEVEAEKSRMLEKIKEMKPEYQEALVMRYIDGLSTKEISSILNITPVAVSVRVHRAVRQLRLLYHAQ